MSSNFGNANYGGKKQFKKTNKFSLKDGDQVFRILPPLGALKDAGVWSRYYSVHFGYKNSEGKHRPFVSPLDKNDKTIKDAALERLNDFKTKHEEAVKNGNGALAAELHKLVGQMGVYNFDKNHYMNVIDLQGNIGVLKIRHKAKLYLDQEIKNLKDAGCDPLSVDNGRYFVFTKTVNPNGRDTTFKVIEYKEKKEVPGLGIVDVPVVHKLTAEIDARSKTEAVNLDTLFPYVTAEECARIVKESDVFTGKSPACDEIFDARWKARRTANQSATPQSSSIEVNSNAQTTANLELDDAPDVDYVPPVAVAPTVTTVPVSAPKVTPVSVKPAETILVKEGTRPQPAPKVAPPTKPIEELSHEEFFKMIGAPQQ